MCRSDNRENLELQLNPIVAIHSIYKYDCDTRDCKDTGLLQLAEREAVWVNDTFV